MQLCRLFGAQLNVFIEFLSRKTEGNVSSPQSFPGRSQHSNSNHFVCTKKTTAVNISFIRQREGRLDGLVFDSLIYFKANTINQVIRNCSGSVFQARGPSLLQVLELLNGKCIYIQLHFNLASNPFTLQCTVLFSYTCRLEVLPFD